MAQEIRPRLPYLLLVLFTLGLDRGTKWWIDTRLLLHQTIEVIDGFFNITYVRNTGVAFGILDSGPSTIKSLLLGLLTLGAIVGVAIYSWRTSLGERLTQISLSLILAGALGNLYDRLRFGYVIDFIEVYYRTYRWPSFNVADSAISTGVALLALEVLRRDSHA
jgi:signal peptidase II